MGRRPGFTAVVVPLLWLWGLARNAAIFSVLDAILLRPLPYNQPEQPTEVWTSFTGIGQPNDQNWVSPPEFRDLQQLNRSFSDLAAIGSGSVNLGVKGSPNRVVGASVSPSLFKMLGAQALVGCTFLGCTPRLRQFAIGTLAVRWILLLKSLRLAHTILGWRSRGGRWWRPTRQGITSRRLIETMSRGGGFGRLPAFERVYIGLNISPYA